MLSPHRNTKVCKFNQFVLSLLRNSSPQDPVIDFHGEERVTVFTGRLLPAVNTHTYYPAAIGNIIASRSSQPSTALSECISRGHRRSSYQFAETAEVGGAFQGRTLALGSPGDAGPTATEKHVEFSGKRTHYFLLTR